MPNDLAIFEGHKIRRSYDEKTETWWFAVVDIVQVLTQQSDFQSARKYWNKLKERLIKEGSQLVTNCHQLKMIADDGKMRLTDAATAETLLRLVQSVPSPKAEPIKLWLAKVGYERMQEMSDPARSLDRARETWKKHGRSDKWIEQRMTGQETRNKLTDYWAGHDIKKGDEYAILTNIIHQEWSDVSVQAHKNLKGLKTQNLRDHMSEAELIFTALAELSTRQIAESADATGMVENKTAAKTGGRIGFTGKLPVSHPPGSLPRILDAMDAARQADIPVVVVQHAAPKPDSPVFREGSPEWELHPDIAARRRDALISKSLPGSFTGTRLEEWLRERKIETVAICGYMTQMCCDTTARQAMHLGFIVEFLSDATGTLAFENSAGRVTAEKLHRAVLVVQQARFSRVLTTEEWIASLAMPLEQL